MTDKGKAKPLREYRVAQFFIYPSNRDNWPEGPKELPYYVNIDSHVVAVLDGEHYASPSNSMKRIYMYEPLEHSKRVPKRDQSGKQLWSVNYG